MRGKSVYSLLIDHWLEKWSEKAISRRCDPGEALVAFGELEVALEEVFSCFPKAREQRIRATLGRAVGPSDERWIRQENEETL